eukprot:TRINITY_DN1600_c0_g1_i3.p1 TRINITY_DN1600_c0_g1~~TRINITY_DN1600_c0_g1_i3.p1  ORF type:complete len:518 (-),score=147.54 TRINITY_DN1600_c0_g1_i3:38-1591(-)
MTRHSPRLRIFVLLLQIWAFCTVAKPAIRGLSPADAEKLTYSSTEFTCADGSRTIPFSQVNDDFCDCEQDGSDEPGTSACINGFFYCENKGHIGQKIYSSQVQDSLCDCCDGSDEYPAECPNTCKELAKETVKKFSEEIKSQMDGLKIKAEWIEKANKDFADKKQRLVVIDQELAQLKVEKEVEEEKQRQVEAERDAKKAELEAAKAQQAEQQAAELAAQQAEQQAAQADEPAVEQPEQPVADDVNTEEKEVEDNEDEDDDAEDEEITEKAEETPEPVPEPAVVAPEVDSVAFAEQAAETARQMAKEHARRRKNRKNRKNSGDDDDDEDDEEPAEPPAEVPEDPELAPYVEAVNSASGKVREISDRIKDLENEKNDINDLFGRDFGEFNEYYGMMNQCTKAETTEYYYEVCPFDKANQNPRHGGSSTSLGKWNWNDNENWTKNGVMKFTGGQKCWGGPDRSLTAEIFCDREIRATDAAEPNKCEYTVKFFTPAACSEERINELKNELKERGYSHDEL